MRRARAGRRRAKGGLSNAENVSKVNRVFAVFAIIGIHIVKSTFFHFVKAVGSGVKFIGYCHERETAEEGRRGCVR